MISFVRRIDKKTPVSIKFDGHPCSYCERTMDMADTDLCPTRDHYPIPKSRRGTKTVIACGRCNVMKADMSATAWQTFMAENPQWWLLSMTAANEKRKEIVRFYEEQMHPAEKPTSAIGDQLMALGLANRLASDFDKIFGSVDSADSGNAADGNNS